MAFTTIGTGTWSGSLTEGAGRATLTTSGLGSFDINWKARSEGTAATTTPEELLGAAHAACYSMATAHTLGERGYTPVSVETSAAVTFEAGKGITGIELSVAATVPGLSAEEFAEVAEEVKTGCPVSAALAAVEITLVSVELRA